MTNKTVLEELNFKLKPRTKPILSYKKKDKPNID